MNLDLALLMIRVGAGGIVAAHGAQKLLGWFGGHGLNATGEFMVQLGFRQGRTFATLASVTEVASGLLVALGLLGPVGPALMISVMIVAAVTVHLKGGAFAQNGGVEVPALYAVGALALALTGFGRYSLDAALGLAPLASPSIAYPVLALGILGGLANLLVRGRASLVGSSNCLGRHRERVRSRRIKNECARDASRTSALENASRTSALMRI